MSLVNKSRLARICVPVLLALVAPAVAVDAGEDTTVKAFAAWQGQGETFRTGSAEATFIGALNGVIYVETENGPVAAGHMTCPAIIEIGLEDATQRGQGRCTITAQDGAQIFAKIACVGVYLVGCNGDLELTGGSARFSGISGGGRVTIRSDTRLIAPLSGDTAREAGTGSLYVAALHYKLP